MVIGIWSKKKLSALSGLMRRLADAVPELQGAVFSECPDSCDILISDGPVPDALHPCRCRLAVLPGDAALDLQYLDAARVVTYGMSRRNTVTVSSMDDNRLFLALQREIVGLTGRRLEQQELVLRSAPGTRTALAAATALLACGTQPELLEHLFENSAPAIE